MADLVIGTIKTTSTTTLLTGVQFGEIVDPGEAVYLKSDGKYWLSNNSTTTLAAAAGIAVTGNAADGYGNVAIGGDIDLGVTLAVGTIYTVSSTSGAIHPELDLATTEILTVLGYGKTTALFAIDVAKTEIAHA